MLNTFSTYMSSQKWVCSSMKHCLSVVLGISSISYIQYTYNSSEPFRGMLSLSTKKVIASKVLGIKVVLSSDNIMWEGSTYQDGWEKNYDSHVTRALYRKNAEKTWDQKTIVYDLMCKKAEIWANILNKSILHKAGLKTTLTDLHRFVFFHLIENLPFDLPHTIYINILRNLKGLGGLDDIY